MPEGALLHLPPTRPDLAVARAVARRATKPIERTLGVVTWLADEKVLLAASLAVWAYCRFGLRSPPARRCGDQIICSTAVAAALPHVAKRFVDRERPDRRVVGAHRHGIPRSGNRWDSFPSGHAVHLGALAATISRLGPPRLRPLVWSVAAMLAATRILLLAHWPSDVAAGLALGVGLDRGVGKALGRLERIGEGSASR
ncbi:MAG: phosphatase PAP2 family protein [Alphaproteobacteria bacterium]|nr:phosphatase PAP2 family protein [Alphaproteobacteria bacterium]